MLSLSNELAQFYYLGLYTILELYEMQYEHWSTANMNILSLFFVYRLLLERIPGGSNKKRHSATRFVHHK